MKIEVEYHDGRKEVVENMVDIVVLTRLVDGAPIGAEFILADGSRKGLSGSDVARTRKIEEEE